MSAEYFNTSVQRINVVTFDALLLLVFPSNSQSYNSLSLVFRLQLEQLYFDFITKEKNDHTMYKYQRSDGFHQTFEHCHNLFSVISICHTHQQLGLPHRTQRLSQVSPCLTLALASDMTLQP